MKNKFSWIVATIFLSLFAHDAEARGFGGGGGGNRGGGGGGGRTASRSPMTGSKMARPTTRPASRPTTRPATRPTTRPTTKPATRPSTQPSTRPAAKPTTRPAERPSTKPATRPAERPSTLPGNTKPGTKPTTRPNERPTTLPGTTRPGTGTGAGNGFNRPTTKPMPLPSRPETKPGNVNYPRPGNRPGYGNNNNIGNRPGFGNNNTVNRPGSGNTIINNRPVTINRPNINTRPVTKPSWDNNKWGNWGNWNSRPGYNRPGFGNNVNIGNNVNVNINNNFNKFHNWGYKPNYWGSRPWWNANHCHGWHHGCWNYGWNKRWYGYYNWYRPRPWPGYVIYDNDNDFAEGVAWGLAAWGLGNMIYNLGYKSYSNPYPAPPVQSSAGTTIINYREPLTVSAGNLPPGDAAAEKTAEEKSTVALEASRASFKRGDYLAAMKSVDEAIAQVPGDAAMHEYRALVLFALGKYGEAAGVLNPVLASGPGWDWTTMTGLYASQTTYTDQLRKLEDYSRAVPDDAATRFLLGYHYLVCGHLDQAYAQFEAAAKLQPADTIAAQLRDLCKSSATGAAEEEAAPPVEADTPRPAIAADKLVGTWVSDRGAQGKVTLNLAADGKFTWTFSKEGENKPADLSGDFSIDERGLLVLSSEDSQMVGEIKLPEDTKLNFILAGGPQGDPGLNFDKAP